MDVWCKVVTDFLFQNNYRQNVYTLPMIHTEQLSEQNNNKIRAGNLYLIQQGESLQLTLCDHLTMLHLTVAIPKV